MSNFDTQTSPFESKLLPQSKKIKKMEKARPFVSNSQSPVESYQESEDIEEGATNITLNISNTENTENTENSNSHSMRYCIFNVDEKKKVLALIKKYIIETLHISPRVNEEKPAQWINWYEDIGGKKFVTFLKRYIPLFRPEMDLEDKKVQAQFFRNIRRWLKNEGLPERRGDPLIPKKDLNKFKKIAHEIIQELSSRKLEDFRKRILPHLRIIREENGLVFKTNMLQKHKWSKFLQENPDTKAYWERLPRTKGVTIRKMRQQQKTRTNESTATKSEFSNLVKHEHFSPNLFENNINVKCEINIKSEMDIKTERIIRTEQLIKKEDFLSGRPFPVFKMEEVFNGFYVEPKIKLEEFCENKLEEEAPCIKEKATKIKEEFEEELKPKIEFNDKTKIEHKIEYNENKTKIEHKIEFNDNRPKIEHKVAETGRNDFQPLKPGFGPIPYFHPLMWIYSQHQK